MLLTLAQIVLPALVLYTTLFGVLARGNPKPGGVALFWRVGLVGLALGGGAYYLAEHTGVLGGATPPLVRDATRGVVGGAVLLVAFAAAGTALKRKD